MLQTMRDNAQGMIAKVIVFFIIFVFALWGVESIVSLGGGASATVSVGGEDITEEDITRVIDQQKRELQSQFGDQYDENLFNEKFMRQSAIERLIEAKVALVKANDFKLYASARSVDEQIVNMPAFKLDGRFNKEQFQNVLRLNGMSPMELRAMLASDVKTGQMPAALVLSSVETPFAVQLSEALNNEVRSFEFTEINVSDLEASVVVSDEDIQAQYELTRDQYKTPEQVAVRYVKLTKASIAASQDVSDEDIQQAYDEYKSREQAREQREASHILVEVSDDRSDADAKALAAKIKADLDNGADFAALAAEFSDDIGTSKQGGNLGLAARGAYVPEFESALFALNEGQISDPVETEYGYHIIRADRIVAADVKSLTDVRDEMIAEVAAAKAEAVYAEQLQELSNISFSAGSVDAVAEILGLQVEQTARFTRDGGEGIAASEEVRQQSFSERVLLDKEISDVIETADAAIVLSVAEHVESSVLPLEVVKPQIVASIKRKQAQELAQAKADAIVSGEAQTAGKWNDVTTAYTQTSAAPRAVQQAAFALTAGGVQSVKTPAGYAVVKLKAIEAKDWHEMVASDESTEAGRAQNSRADLLSYQSWSRATVEIERNGS